MFSHLKLVVVADVCVCVCVRERERESERERIYFIQLSSFKDLNPCIIELSEPVV